MKNKFVAENRTQDPKLNRHRFLTGFTLLELLIVIGILAILATLAILVLNPAELLRQARDTQRINDLASVNKALSFLQIDQPEANFGTASTTYISLPDTDDANPADCDEYSLPSLPSGWFYYCALKSNYRKTDSTGWIPVNLTTLFSTGSPLSNLPIDPVNTAQNSLYYTYIAGGSWELTTMLEAAKNRLGGSQDQVSKDGGDSYELYELGSNLSVSPINDSGLVGYWKLDEGSGTTASDSSGNNNAGTLTNGPTWTSGKVGGAVSFDGVNDFIFIPYNSSLDTPDAITIEAWIYPHTAPNNYGTIINSGWNIFNSYWLSINGAGSLVLYLTGLNDYSLFFAGAANFNQWSHVAVTYDRYGGSGNAKAYINGGLVDSQTRTGSITAYAGERYIAGSSYGYIFDGPIDEARIYNRALSAAEIKTIYDATK